MNNNKKISDELLKATAQSDPDTSSDSHNASALTIKRAHKRLRILGILTITFWLLAAVVLIIFVHIFFTFFFPRFVEAHNLVQPETIGSEIVQILAWLCIAAVYLSFAFVALASLTTVLMIVTSRKATLSQIQVNLADISNQLKQLSQSPNTNGSN